MHFDTSYPLNENPFSARPFLPYKRGLIEPFLIFGASGTLVVDVLVVFMEIHVRFMYFDTSYPKRSNPSWLLFWPIFWWFL